MSIFSQRKTHPPARMMVFIDGGYLKKWIVEKCNVEIMAFPFNAFVTAIVEKVMGSLDNAIIIRIYFYDGLAEPSDRDYAKQKEIHDYIRRKFSAHEVRLGHLVRDGEGKFRQKGVDVLLGIDMVDKANSNQYDIALIVAGDLDHLEAVKTVKNKGKQVAGVVYVGSASEELVRNFDNVIFLEQDTIDKIIPKK